MILFDSHCHLDDNAYDNDRLEVMNRAWNEGVRGIMVVGVDLQTSLDAIQIAKNHDQDNEQGQDQSQDPSRNMTKAHPRVITSVGIHPHDAANCSQEKIGRASCRERV